MKKEKRDARIILHNVRSAYNVGSIFRTADAAGVSKIYLSGYTPPPIDKFGRINKEISKTALGAERFLAWEKRASVSALLKRLKQEGVYVVAIEQAKSAIDYKKARIPCPAAFIFGNEVRGLPGGILAQCNSVASIPMRGKKESLNVSIAAGIALFRILDL